MKNKLKIGDIVKLNFNSIVKDKMFFIDLDYNRWCKQYKNKKFKICSSFCDNVYELYHCSNNKRTTFNFYDYELIKINPPYRRIIKNLIKKAGDKLDRC